jgi:hypothetical protein
VPDQTDLICLPKRYDRFGLRRPIGIPKIAIALVLLGGTASGLLIGGCGSGHSTSVSDSSSSLRSVTIAIQWPKTTTRNVLGRDIPISTNSVTLTITDSGGFTESQTLNKPDSGSTTGSTTGTASFIGLRPGTLQVAATAFSGTNGSGDVVDTVSTTATLGAGSSANIQLAFADVPFSSIQLQVPGSTTIQKGQTLSLGIIGFDANGHEISTTASGQWSTTNAAVASVSASGVVTGLAPGVSTIAFTDATTGLKASVGVTVAGFVSLTIAAPNGVPALPEFGTLPLTASGVDATGAAITAPPGTWSSSNTAVATVGSTGVVTGVTPGTTTITFTDATYGQKATLGITVTVTPFASIKLTASGSTTLLQTQTVTLTATALDGSGNTLQVSPPGSWASSNNAIATVDKNGVVTALQPGSATITFTDSTYKLTASVTIVVHGGNSTVTVQ